MHQVNIRNFATPNLFQALQRVHNYKKVSQSHDYLQDSLYIHAIPKDRYALTLWHELADINKLSSRTRR